MERTGNFVPGKNGSMNLSEIKSLDGFRSISLKEMDAVRLLDRVDTKFTFHFDQLPLILEELKPFYRILSFKASRITRYKTEYFDTPELKLYTQHHNGKLNRWKVRERKYGGSGQCFFEVKFKNNKGRVIKERIKIKELHDTIDGSSSPFLIQKTPYTPGMLEPVLTVLYDRITLVGYNLDERLTIDTRLSFLAKGESCSFPWLVIAECKQEKASCSPFISLMRQHHIRKQSVSKYCLGIASLYPEVKKNNFKKKLHHINHLNHAHS